MTLGNPGQFDPEHLKRWWEVTRNYLFADSTDGLGAPDRSDSTPCWMICSQRDRCESAMQVGGATTGEAESPRLNVDSRGGQSRFISRVRGSLLHRANRVAQRQRNPLQELECAFQLQIAFIARHPEVPERLLGWLAKDGNARIGRRIQTLIDHYASRLSRIIDRARLQGLVRADIDPLAAARLLVSVVQGLATRAQGCPDPRDALVSQAASAFAAFRLQLACPAQ
ncbi:MAG: hypothetical protein Q8K96_11305 [Rubrivivax sp.]|nr:hypothetical protein [Rubrivivax sp.]